MQYTSVTHAKQCMRWRLVHAISGIQPTTLTTAVTYLASMKTSTLHKHKHMPTCPQTPHQQLSQLFAPTLTLVKRGRYCTIKLPLQALSQQIHIKHHRSHAHDPSLPYSLQQVFMRGFILKQLAAFLIYWHTKFTRDCTGTKQQLDARSALCKCRWCTLQ